MLFLVKLNPEFSSEVLEETKGWLRRKRHHTHEHQELREVDLNKYTLGR